MKIIIGNYSFTAGLLLAFALILSSCGTTNIGGQADMSEVNNITVESDSFEVFQATLGALNETGFVIRTSNSSEGSISADFINQGGGGNENRFFGYSSRVSRHVTAEFNLVRDEDNGLTHVILNLTEVFPPSPSQYGSIRTTDTTRQVRDRKYYEGLLKEIEQRLNM